MEKSIDQTSYKPLYLQISEILRNQIKEGKYSAGDMLPSESELLDNFPVSRNTAKRALEELVRDGLAVRIQGKGTFVPKSIVDFGLHRLTSFTEETLFKGLVPSSKVIKFVQIPANELLSKSLEIAQGDSVYQLKRIRFGDDFPMAIQESFIPEKLCKGLDAYDFSQESLFFVLEKKFGLKISWQKQYIKPCIARKKEAAALDIDVGSPLLFMEGVAYLERDIPFEFKQDYYRSDLYDFSMRSIRN